MFDVINEDAKGFGFWPVTAQRAMGDAHTHSDIELNYLDNGELTYFRQGGLNQVRGGQLAIFWGGVPHQTVSPGIAGRGIWVYLPLAWFMQWRLPCNMRARILAGEMFLADVQKDLFQNWMQDFTSQNTERRHALVLELEAFFVRLALRAPVQSRAQISEQPSGIRQIERITSHIVQRYREPITIESIARAMKLHPKYLMRVFRKHCGVSVWSYVTKLRIAHAQRLLIMTDRKVVDIAFEAGFESLAPFYSAFRCEARGETPIQYRHRYQNAALQQPTATQPAVFNPTPAGISTVGTSPPARS